MRASTLKITALLLTCLVVILALGLHFRSTSSSAPPQSGASDRQFEARTADDTPTGAVGQTDIKSDYKTEVMPNGASISQTTPTESIRSQPPAMIAPPDTLSEAPGQLLRQANSPFPISQSVLSNCLKGGAHRCDDQVIDLLERLATEERNAVWATEAETRLRALALGVNRENVVRECHCGSTVCAIEVASTQGRYGGYLDHDTWLNGQLELWDGIYGYETDDSGIRTTISLKTYRRR